MSNATMERNPETGKFIEQPDSLAKPTAVRLPKDLRDDVIELAKSQSKSKGEVIREAVDYWVKFHLEHGEAPK